MSDYIAPARRLYHAAHKPAGDGQSTVCGMDTTDPEELWQPVSPADVATVCTACLAPDSQPEELTLL